MKQKISLVILIFCSLSLVLIANAQSVGSSVKSIEISPTQTTISIACKSCVGGTPTGKVDSNGCPIYNCPPIQACTACVGGTPTGKVDANGCPIYDCPIQACTACVGGTPTGKIDTNGCPIYNCPTDPGCKACVVGTPTGKVDANGCPIYDCPILSCTACVGGTPTGKVDSNNCPIYSCPGKTCPIGCICENDTVTCPTTEKKSIGVKVETVTGINPIEIGKTGNELTITEGNTTAVTTEKLVIEESKLYIETSTGNKQIKVLPEEASSKATAVTSVNTIELKEESQQPIYSVKGTKQVKLLLVIPVSMQIETKVSAESGNVISVKKPWWSFLAR